jgi:hypothetical protein
MPPSSTTPIGWPHPNAIWIPISDMRSVTCPVFADQPRKKSALSSEEKVVYFPEIDRKSGRPIAIRIVFGARK